MKKTALISAFFNSSRTLGVQTGEGPSSKVRATAFLFDSPRLMTGRKKPKRGKKGAAAQIRISPANGITDKRTSKISSNIAISNDPMPNLSAGESDNLPESTGLIEFNVYG